MGSKSLELFPRHFLNSEMSVPSSSIVCGTFTGLPSYSCSSITGRHSRFLKKLKSSRIRTIALVDNAWTTQRTATNDSHFRRKGRRILNSIQSKATEKNLSGTASSSSDSEDEISSAFDNSESGQSSPSISAFDSPEKPQEKRYDENRWKVIFATSLAFVICNMDKVNMSVAIIPMAEKLGWSASTAGLVQSSFFCGYALSQLPGGWLAQYFSGRKVLEMGVLLWSLGTAVVPLAASVVPTLLIMRLLIGLGEGVAPPAATDLIAKTVPPEERSRSVATVFGGLNVGSVLGLILAPLCIEKFGWESVFYIFGSLGLLWWGYFKAFVGKTGEKPSSNDHSSSVPPTSDPHAVPVPTLNKMVPWPSFFHCPPFLALIWAHFCHDWGKYALQSWLPSYYKSELHLSLTQASQIAILAPLASVGFSALAAIIADRLIERQVDTSRVRSLMQCIAFLAPALCMTAVCQLEVALNPWLVVGLLTTGMGLSSFALAGLYCTHQDISPKYAGILLGITNTAGAIPGFLGTALTGILYDATGSWNVSLFYPSIFFSLAGAVVWLLFASSKPQDFDKMQFQT